MSSADVHENGPDDVLDESVEEQPVSEEMGEQEMEQLAGGARTLNTGRVVKSAPGTIAAFPDVCNTPSPGGPIPAPYPNTGKASDASKGTKTTK